MGAHRVAKRSQSGGCAADLAADLLTAAGGQPWPRGAPLGAVNVGATASLGAPAAAVHVEEGGGGGGGGSSREPTVRVDAAEERGVSKLLPGGAGRAARGEYVADAPLE